MWSTKCIRKKLFRGNNIITTVQKWEELIQCLISEEAFEKTHSFQAKIQIVAHDQLMGQTAHKSVLIE